MILRQDEEDDPDLEAAMAASLREIDDYVPARPSSADNANARTSFGSFPRSSQSSKRILEHGLEVVRGSDTDTDGSEELEDLSKLFKMKAAPKSTAPSITSRVSATETTNMSLRDRAPKNTRRDTHELTKVPKKTYKFSLDTLVSQSKRASSVQARTTEAKSKLWAEDNKWGSHSDHYSIDQTTLVELVEGGDVEKEGQARRVANALARANAFHLNEVWHFFDEDVPDKRRLGFPKISTDSHSLNVMLNGMNIGSQKDPC